MTYHVACGMAGIYAGVVDKDETAWVDKSIVTDEATAAVAQWLIENKQSMVFKFDGKPYVLQVKERT